MASTEKALDTEYNQEFYDTIRSSSEVSAHTAVIEFGNFYDIPSTVADVGGGQGYWAKEFQEQYGADVALFDGSYATTNSVVDYAIDIDLSCENPSGRYDLVVCLEVAEHLPNFRAEAFVSALANMSDKILFSAAIPHQSGHGHINCQWQSYWADLFSLHSLYPDTRLRDRLWTNPDVESWYKQNIVYYSKTPGTTSILDVVHPEIYQWSFE